MARIIRKGSSENVMSGSERCAQQTSLKVADTSEIVHQIAPKELPLRLMAIAFTVKSRRDMSSESVPSSTTGLRDSLAVRFTPRTDKLKLQSLVFHLSRAVGRKDGKVRALPEVGRHGLGKLYS